MSDQLGRSRHDRRPLGRLVLVASQHSQAVVEPLAVRDLGQRLEDGHSVGQRHLAANGRKVEPRVDQRSVEIVNHAADRHVAPSPSR